MLKGTLQENFNYIANSVKFIKFQVDPSDGLKFYVKL